MSDDRFLETVLRTEHLTERDWLELLEQRKEDVRYWIRQISSTKLSTFPCLDRRAQGRGFIPVDPKAYSSREPLSAYGIFERRPPRSASDDCTFYIVGFIEPGVWLIASVYSRKDDDGSELVLRARVDAATPSHIVEMAVVCHGDLWFMLGRAIEELAKKRREELEHLTALEQRIKVQNQMVVAIETDHRVTV